MIDQATRFKNSATHHKNVHGIGGNEDLRATAISIAALRRDGMTRKGGGAKAQAPTA